MFLSSPSNPHSFLTQTHKTYYILPEIIAFVWKEFGWGTGVLSACPLCKGGSWRTTSRFFFSPSPLFVGHADVICQMERGVNGGEGENGDNKPHRTIVVSMRRWNQKHVQNRSPSPFLGLITIYIKLGNSNYALSTTEVIYILWLFHPPVWLLALAIPQAFYDIGP